MKKQYDVYIKKLTTQELGYRKGRLMTGGYFYISKSAIGTFFSELNKFRLNDFMRLEFNDPLELGNVIQASLFITTETLQLMICIFSHLKLLCFLKRVRISTELNIFHE